MNIEEVRKKFPQYSDLSDEDLAKGLHKKYYSDIPYEEFSTKIGMSTVKPVPGKPKEVSKFSKTLESVSKAFPGLPAFEVAAEMASSSAAVPISGLVGLAMLPFDKEGANNAIASIQRHLIYKPQTEEGQKLSKIVNYPFQKLEQAAGYVGGKLEKSGHPYAGLAAETAMITAPALLGAKSMLSKGKTAPQKQLTSTIENGINKGVRPSVIKKEMYGQRAKYMKDAETAVTEIIKNKENLKLLDRDGNTTTGLPKTLEQFSHAIEQTKRDIYQQYDALAKQADAASARVTTQPIVSELSNVLNDNVLQTMAPETIAYAKARIKALDGKSFTTSEAQQAIQLLNESQKSYYANPSPTNKGVAYVDSMIANNLRSGIDAAIEAATGEAYAPLKQKYGALRTLETDVTKRAIVDARKNIKGLIDFSDVFSSSQLIYGVFSKQPASVAAGATAKGISSYIKYINDPNRIIKSTFKKSEKLMNKKKSVFRPMLGLESTILSGRED